MKKILLIILCIVPLISIAQEKKKVTLSAGTVVSVRTLSPVTSQSSTTPQCVVNADVYDDDGEVVLITAGTPVAVQQIIRKATLIGDAGQIIFQPISTQAFNGRLIGFEQNDVVFTGNDEAIFKSRKKATVPAGTAFRATIATDYHFTITIP
ncbi:MAG: hypothetical protein ACI392_01360 [Paludibacteraceae bacterium]